jgi:pteridine reductase
MTEIPAVLVTGAARRVGAAIARLLHGNGVRVMLHYGKSAAEAQTLAAELNDRRPGSAACHGADLLDTAAIQLLVETTVARFGRLDAVVNNASTFFSTPVGAIDDGAWENLIGSNLKGPLFLSQAAAPHLAASAGCIVNITDIHAERPLKGYGVYCAAKAGLLGLTRSLAIELAPAVRVNAVAPGPIQWPDNDESFSPKQRELIVANTPLQRIGQPEDIAKTVKFLIFEAPYITGQVINVDGGQTIHL